MFNSIKPAFSIRIARRSEGERLAVAELVERFPQRREGPSAVEARVLAEKASGLSDLEVAAKLMLSQRTVRAIVCRHGRDSSTTFSLRLGSETRSRVAGIDGMVQ